MVKFMMSVASYKQIMTEQMAKFYRKYCVCSRLSILLAHLGSVLQQPVGGPASVKTLYLAS